ncbi:MAG: glycosyltransferase family 2 protein [Candidatus Binatia bacterium]
MSKVNSPAMSVILATPDRYDTIRKTIACLRAQTARDRLELVIVAPCASKLELNQSEMEEFFKFRLAEVGHIKSIGAANAAGVRHASAPVVALAEDHAFPNPAWAEALIHAHQEDWAAVGPVVRNANPGSTISYADFLIAYGVWQEGVSGGIVDHLPGHNSSYKRSVLLDYGPDLETMLEAESVLHWDLNRKGYRLYLEPRAKISHLNFGVISAWLPAQYHSGRMFAATRSREWSKAKRLLYTCSAPLIPALRFWRILRQSYQYSRKLPLRVCPALVLGLMVSALGEMIGYASGAGRSRKSLTRLEFHRVRHIGRRRRFRKTTE